MPSHKLCTVLSATVVATLFATGLFAQTSAQGSEHHRYKLIDLGTTFGGAESGFAPGSGNEFGDIIGALNGRGYTAGYAETGTPEPFPNYCYTSACLVVHPFRAGKRGFLTDLGSLPGGGDSIPTWISDSGLVVGFSENGQTDPLYPRLPQLRAVLWSRGRADDLGTLPSGGYQSAASSVNDRGEVVGSALNTIPDNNSMQVGDFPLWGNPGGIAPPYPYQLRAFFWDKNGGMQDLGTLGGSDARALLINERGQVLGHSYTGSNPSLLCNYPLATNSFRWDKERGMIDLGSLGGTCTLGFTMNQSGQIAGSSNLRGDSQLHAFFWDGAIHDLGSPLRGSYSGAEAISQDGNVAGYAYLPGDMLFRAFLWKSDGHRVDLRTVGTDLCSFANAINGRGQVAGGSIADCRLDDPTVRAFLWDRGTMWDLNALIPAGSSLYLQSVISMNENGEIAGNGVDAADVNHAFLAIPCDESHADVEGCDYSMVNAASVPEVPRPAVQTLRTRSAAAMRLWGAPLPWSIRQRSKKLLAIELAGEKRESFDATAGATIISFSPTSGPDGVSVVIRGTALSNTKKITFGGAQVDYFTVNSPEKVTAMVPLTAKSGKISITTTDGTATSSETFKVDYGSLDGQCVVPVGSQCIVKSSPECPSGKPAIDPGAVSCGWGPLQHDVAVDESRRCAISGVHSFFGRCLRTNQ